MSACPTSPSGHFFHGGKCVICDAVLPCCRNCARGYLGDDRYVHCGAGVDDAALQGRKEGDNPIWAERKRETIWSLLAGLTDVDDSGSDCEKMSPDDGRKCKLFEMKNEAG